MHASERAHYRIRYPTTERPSFVAEETHSSLPVVDCSEAGLRYRLVDDPHAVPPELGDPVRGEIRFRSGASAEVAGIVVRIQGGEVAVHLTERKLPFRVMVQEQLMLRRRYRFVDVDLERDAERKHSSRGR